MSSFDSIYYHVAVNVSSSNPTKALYITDSLFANSETELQKLRSLMLKADLLEKQGKREEAIENTLTAMKIAEATADYQWQAKIYGFLSTQYRILGFLDQGKIYLKKGIEISSKIENKELASQFRGMTYQEMAYYSFEERKYKEAIESLELASLSFDIIKSEQFKNFLIGNNEEMFGRSYTGLNDYTKAKTHHYKSLQYLKKAEAENTQWGAMNYNGLGHIFLKENQMDSAGVYLNKALDLSEKTDHISLKELVYQNMAAYYKKMHIMDSFAVYENKYNAIVQENISKSKKSINSEFNRINQNPETATNNRVYLILGALFVLMLAGVAYAKRKTWFGNLINAEGDEKKPEPLILPQKTEEDLLNKLNDFENSHEYLDKNISFSVLAGQLGTNAKYLSHILKNNKNTDYNTYINELRIQYIVDKLKTDPDYLNYKISFLAEESGFSSHSKFSANFKRMVNLSPSEFIDSLRE